MLQAPPARVIPSPGFDCQSCGACCATSSLWPRFTTEDDAALAAIPAALVNAGGSGMACNGSRCKALAGTLGTWTSCTIYSDRPLVCRACEPGDPECITARRLNGIL